MQGEQKLLDNHTTRKEEDEGFESRKFVKKDERK